MTQNEIALQRARDSYEQRRARYVAVVGAEPRAEPTPSNRDARFYLSQLEGLSRDLILVCSAVLLALKVEIDADHRHRWNELQAALYELTMRWNDAATSSEELFDSLLAIREDLFDTSAELYTDIGLLSATMAREKSVGPSHGTVVFFVSILLIALSTAQLFIFVPTADLRPGWREGAIALGGLVMPVVVFLAVLVLMYRGARVFRYFMRRWPSDWKWP